MCSGSFWTTLLRVLVEMAAGSGLTLILDKGFHRVEAVFFHESTKFLVVRVLFANFGGELPISDDSVDELLSRF